MAYLLFAVCVFTVRLSLVDTSSQRSCDWTHGPRSDPRLHDGHLVNHVSTLDAVFTSSPAAQGMIALCLLIRPDL